MASGKLHHVEMLDIDESGILTEVCIVKKDEEGNIFYINNETLHPIDKARLKKIVTSQHADKYPLWELLSQARLSNGMNALDYFHYNFVKVKRAPGSKLMSAGLTGLTTTTSQLSELAGDKIIGSETADAFAAEVDHAHFPAGAISTKGL